MASYLGVDIGTSSVKAALIDARQALIAEASHPLAVSRPQPLWSEQDPEDWWRATQAAIADLRAAAPEAWRELQAIGLSGQQHGATLLDAEHRVLRPCILWNDGRAHAQCEELARRVEDFPARASNAAMPGFTAPKLLWVAQHEPDVFARTAMVLLPKDYVRLKLSGECVSEMSDASGTLWLDIGRRRWDETLLAACGLATRHMPTLAEGGDRAADLAPELAARWGLGARKIPIAGGGGDNACAAVGMGAVHAGDGFMSLGTSGVIFAATDRPVALPQRGLHGFCHALPQRWHAMSVTLSAASALQWVAALVSRGDDIGGLLAQAQDHVAVAQRRRDAPVFLPYLAGERTPHNDAQATAAFAGLTMAHGAPALAYAVAEGVAFALADGLDVLAQAGAAPKTCLLTGGGARSAFFAQLIADATGLTLDLPAGAELGAAFGAARLAMIAAGGAIYEICVRPAIVKSFAPRLEPLLAARRARMQGLYQDQRRRAG